MSKKKLAPENTFTMAADVHLGAKLYNIPELEQDMRELFDMFVTTTKELKPGYMIVAGDLYDTNKPTAEYVSFVTDQVRRLDDIIPLAIAGDHDKPTLGKSWVCNANGFKPISYVPQFAGVDYNDDPESVMTTLKGMLENRKDLEWIFLHGQVPELWKFCDEKKTLRLKDLDYSKHCDSLKGVLLGDIHRPLETRFHDPTCNKDIFVGYVGSLGVVKSDETNKVGFYYYDGHTLHRVSYDLPRRFISVDITDDTFLRPSYLREEIEKRTDTSKKRPVITVNYPPHLKAKLPELTFLYDMGIPKFTRVSGGKEEERESINLRSELKTNDRATKTLRTMFIDDQAFKLADSLVSDPDSAKAILDTFKEEMFA